MATIVAIGIMVSVAACTQTGTVLTRAPFALPHNGEIAPVVPLSPAALAEFTRRVSNGWCRPTINGNSIASRFAPDLSGLADLTALANLGGFDHFNIEQQISQITQGNLPLALPRWTGVDPALGGNIFTQFDDSFAWYYEEVPAPGQWLPMHDDPNVHVFSESGADIALEWRDAPNIGPQNAGVVMSFVDYLIGVYPDHSGVRISEAFAGAQNVNFAWTFRQGKWGARHPDRMRFADFDTHDPGSEGAVTFNGFFSSDATAHAPTAEHSCAQLIAALPPKVDAARAARSGSRIHAREMHAQLLRRR